MTDTILFPVPPLPVPMMCVVFAGVCLFSKSNISKFASSVFTKTEHCRFGNKINEYHLLWCRNPKIKHHNIIVLQLSIEPFDFLFKYILLGSRTRYISLLKFLTERWRRFGSLCMCGDLCSTHNWHTPQLSRYRVRYRSHYRSSLRYKLIFSCGAVMFMTWWCCPDRHFDSSPTPATSH